MVDGDAAPAGGARDDGRLAVLAMAYGTPAGPGQIEPYYTHIRRGRPPSAELLAELQGRYAAIGGSSPLLAISRAQADALRDALAGAGVEAGVALGFKHTPPFIEEVAAGLAQAGCGRIVGIVLAPHYSRMSVGEYEQRARSAVQSAPQPAEITVVPHWHLAADYLEFLAQALDDAFAALPPHDVAGAHVLFTAHSLPERILETGDPYPDQLHETAAAVADLAGLERWSVAWQSAGRTAERWIGPDVLEELERLATSGTRAVIVCAAGFVADHLEVLYDLDIEARGRAAELGVAFARTRSPNASPQLARAMAQAVLAQLATVP